MTQLVNVAAIGSVHTHQPTGSHSMEKLFWRTRDMIKPFKIRVENDAHSREIQEYLFNHKVPWYSSGYEVENTDKPFLFVYPDYGGWKPNITYTRYEESFNDNQLPEMWFYDNKLQDHPPKNILLEELHSVLDKYDITISLVQGCDLMLLKSGSNETLGVYFEEILNSETIKEYIDACTIQEVGFEPSRLFDPYIVNYLGKDIPVPYTFKEGWLATDENGEIYGYREEPVIISPNSFTANSTDTFHGIDYLYLGKMGFKLPYKNWKESKLFFDISEEK